MQFLKTFNQEMEKSFQKIEYTYYPSGMPENYLKPQQRKDIKEFITSSHTQLLKQFLEEEVEYIKENLKIVGNPTGFNEISSWLKGRKETLQSELDHYQNLIKELV